MATHRQMRIWWEIGKRIGLAALYAGLAILFVSHAEAASDVPAYVVDPSWEQEEVVAELDREKLPPMYEPDLPPEPTPAVAPTASPTEEPTEMPAVAPTASPTADPTEEPMKKPTVEPASEPPGVIIGANRIQPSFKPQENQMVVEGFKVDTRDNKNVRLRWKKNSGVSIFLFVAP